MPLRLRRGKLRSSHSYSRMPYTAVSGAPQAKEAQEDCSSQLQRQYRLVLPSEDIGKEDFYLPPTSGAMRERSINSRKGSGSGRESIRRLRQIIVD